jgi:hypothetical protein
VDDSPVEWAEDFRTYQLFRRPVPRVGAWGLVRGDPISGYGDKLRTDYVLQFEGDKIRRRVYAICHSNVSSLYVLVKGRRLFIRTSWSHSDIPNEV